MNITSLGNGQVAIVSGKVPAHNREGITMMKELTAEERMAKIKRLYYAVEVLRNLKADMPIQTFSTFLMIVMNEGKTVTEIGAAAGLALSSSSRNVSMLADLTYDKKKGLGLAKYEVDSMNLTVKHVKLTPKGKQTLAMILQNLQ